MHASSVCVPHTRCTAASTAPSARPRVPARAPTCANSCTSVLASCVPLGIGHPGRSPGFTVRRPAGRRGRVAQYPSDAPLAAIQFARRAPDVVARRRAGDGAAVGRVFPAHRGHGRGAARGPRLRPFARHVAPCAQRPRARRRCRHARVLVPPPRAPPPASRVCVHTARRGHRARRRPAGPRRRCAQRRDRGLPWPDARSARRRGCGHAQWRHAHDAPSFGCRDRFFQNRSTRRDVRRLLPAHRDRRGSIEGPMGAARRTCAGHAKCVRAHRPVERSRERCHVARSCSGAACTAPDV